MDKKEWVRQYFQGQRQMTEEEQYAYQKAQWKQYQEECRAKYFPAFPLINIKEVLEELKSED